MFPEYYCIEANDFADVPKASLSSTEIDITKYVDDFPVLDRILFTRSPATHYHVVRSMIAKITEITNTEKLRCAIDVLRYLVATMPRYPDGMVRPLNDSAIHILSGKSPDLLPILVIRNPSFGLKSENELIKMSVVVGGAMNETQPDAFEVRIRRLSDELTNDKAKMSASVLKYLIETTITENRQSNAVYALIHKLLFAIPDELLYMKGINTRVVVKTVIPYSLSDASSFDKVSALKTLVLYRFAYDVVKGIIDQRSMASIIPFHRLSISGSAAVDALLFALWRFKKDIWPVMFSKSTSSDVKLAFGSVICCLLTCVELPSLKLFVKSSVDHLKKFVRECIQSASSIAVQKAFLDTNSVLLGHGVSTISLVYQKWLQNQANIAPIRTLMNLSPLDPVFPALLIESIPFLARDFNACIDLAIKMIFSGPSLATSHAMRILGASVDYPLFIQYCYEIRNTAKFIPAVHFIIQSERCPNPKENKVVVAYKNVVTAALASESYVIGDDMVLIANYLHLLKGEHLVEMMRDCQRDGRTLLRFFVTVASMPRLPLFLEGNPEFSEQLAQTWKAALHITKENVRQLTIAWHNICLSFYKNKKEPTTPSAVSLIRNGATALVPYWSLTVMIDCAFFDVIEAPQLRPIVVPVLASAPVHSPKIYGRLKVLCQDLVDAHLGSWSDVRTCENTQEVPPMMLWRADVWKQWLCGKSVGIFSV